MKKTIIFLAMALGIVACNDANDAALDGVGIETSAVTEAVDSVSTATTKMQKTYDGTWFRSRRNFGSNSGPDYQEFQNYIVGQSSFAFAHNVTKAGECPGGFQEIDAHRPVAGYDYHYMKVRCFKPGGGTICLPYPKIKYVPKPRDLNSIRVLTARVESTVPTVHEGWGWPHGNGLKSFENSQFNLAFDIYFSKPGQKQDNYCALMIWLTYEGGIGPAYIKNQLWKEAKIDGVDYYVVGRKDWANCDYQINYVRKNKSADISNINILAIINHIKANDFMGCNLSDSKLTNLNLGFEIFDAQGDVKNQTFIVNKYNLNLQ